MQHSPTLSKKDQQSLKREWLKKNGQIPCAIKYHGSKNLGSSYKYIVKVSPQTFLKFLVILETLHLSPLFPYFCCIIPKMYVDLAPYPVGSISPFWQPLLEKTGEPNRGASGPFPHMAAVAHITERYTCSYISLVIYIYIYEIIKLTIFFYFLYILSH